jgi:hypothetical protein
MKMGLAASLLAILTVPTTGIAKEKTKTTLPAYVLAARTVAVVIDPDAGVSLEDPNANQVAQKDVETALLGCGRFEPVLSVKMADLIIVVRKGTGKVASPTVHEPRQDSRPGDVTSVDNGISVGVQHGPRPGLSGAPLGTQPDEGPHPQAEVGNSQDSFTVYEGQVENPLDRPAAWRYIAKDGLHPHNVPAVDEFRKAVQEAVKAASKTP